MDAVGLIQDAPRELLVDHEVVTHLLGQDELTLEDLLHGQRNLIVAAGQMKRDAAVGLGFELLGFSGTPGDGG